MADRRMFHKDVVLSDNFLEMDEKTKNLYFAFGMMADDDGLICNPKSIVRMYNATNENVDELVENGFIIAFPSGILAIRHWKINNYIQKDRYHMTQFTDEFSMLMEDKYGNYILEGEHIRYFKSEKKVTKGRALRIAARKASDLPSVFDQVIRNAFEGEICPICGDEMCSENSRKMPSIQHNVPISKGGLHDIDNISVICRSCNSMLQNNVETPPYNTEKVKEVWKKYVDETA